MFKNIVRLTALLTLTANAYVLDLETAQQKANTNNLQLKNARHTWLMQKNNPKIARSSLLPQLTMGRTDSKSREEYPGGTEEEGNFSMHYTQEQESLTLGQTLFDLNKYYTVTQSKQQATQDLLTYRQAIQSTLLKTSQRYFDLILAIENVEFLSAQAQETQKRQTDIQTLLSHGAATKSQELEITAQLQRVKADIIEAKQIMQNRKDLLSDTIGCTRFTAVKALSKHSKNPKFTYTGPTALVAGHRKK